MLECLYVRSGLTVHKEMYAEHIQNYKNALFNAKSDYYSNIIGVSNGNSRLLFSMVNYFCDLLILCHLICIPLIYVTVS